MEETTDKKVSIPSESIVPVLACVLDQLCAKNDQLPIDQNSFTMFHAMRPPLISLREYLERIAKFACCSGECFVLSLVYIDCIIHNNSSFVVNSLNVHRLLITRYALTTAFESCSIMLASKNFDDHYYNNAYYGRIGGVSSSEINSLEVELLFMLNFNLFVTPDQYSQYYIELCRHAIHSPCSCSHGPPLYALMPSPQNRAQLVYDLDKRMTSTTCLLTPSPSPNYPVPISMMD